MASDSRCINQYLLGKTNTSYEALKSSLRNSRAPLSTLESLTFFKAEKDILDVLLNVLAATDDKKTARIIHYFLTEVSQYKFTNVAETKLINTTFTKEVQHKDLARKVSAIRNYVLLAPNDSLIEANLKDLVIGMLRKTADDKKEKEKEKKKFFTRGTDSSSKEKSMVQYGALVACRHRFAKPQQQLFVPVIDAIRSDDPAGARHATFLTLEFTKEAPSNVAPNIHRFLPHLKGKEAAYLVDPLARVYFANICTLIGLKADNSDNDFFQALVQTVLDTNIRVSFEGMSSLTLFPWSRLEKAVLLPILPPPVSSSSSDSPPLWESIVAPTPLFTAIVKRLTTSLSLTSVTTSSPLVHGACRTVKLISEAFSNHLSTVEKEKQEQQTSANNPQPEPNLALDDEFDEHPLALLYNHVVALLDAPSMHVRSLALRTLVWLGLPNNSDSLKFRNILVAQLTSGTLSASIIEGVFSEWLRRVKSVTHFAGLVLTLISDLCWLAPEKVNFAILFSIWKTIIGFGPKGRALVLGNLFEILDKDLIPQQRTISINIKKNIFWFLGENGNVLVDEIPAHYKGSVSPDINNPGLKAIVLRLSQEALLGAWEVRSICTEALAKIAILSASLTRIHIYGVATHLLEEGSTSVAKIASSLVVLLDQLLDGRRKWLPTFKENPDTLEKEQLELLHTTHTNLVQQCEVICEVPKDFCPLGPECLRYLTIYNDK